MKKKTSFKMFKKSALKMFFKKENAFNAFVGPRGCTQWVLVGNTECKRNFFVYKKTQRGTIRKAKGISGQTFQKL